MAALAPNILASSQSGDDMMPLKVPLPSCAKPKSRLAGASGITSEETPDAPWPHPDWVSVPAYAANAPAPFLGANGFVPGYGSQIQYAAMCAAMVEAQLQQRMALDELQYSGMGSRGQFASAAVPPPLPTATSPLLPMMTEAASAAPAMVSGAPAPASSNPIASSAAAARHAAAAAADADGYIDKRRRTPQTLSTSLRSLEDEDAGCLLIVRRISKLGFKATRSLKKHFSVYGPVVRVLLAHSTARQYSAGEQFSTKRRPSNLGFIQMGTSEAVKLILAQGQTHEVEGVAVNVQRFERYGGDESGEDEDGQSKVPQMPPSLVLSPANNKFERGVSDASTSTGGATLDWCPMALPQDFGDDSQQ